MEGWRRVIKDVPHRKEVVAANLAEYASSGKRSIVNWFQANHKLTVSFCPVSQNLERHGNEWETMLVISWSGSGGCACADGGTFGHFLKILSIRYRR